MITPLLLDRYVIERLEIASNSGYSEADIDSSGMKELRAEASIIPEFLSLESNPHQHQIVLDVQFRSAPDAQPLPYDIRIKGRGYFHLDASNEIEEQAKGRLLALNGSAILLGLLRAQVAQVTALGEHGAFLLPPINLVEALRKWAEEADGGEDQQEASDSTSKAEVPQ